MELFQRVNVTKVEVWSRNLKKIRAELNMSVRAFAAILRVSHVLAYNLENRATYTTPERAEDIRKNLLTYLHEHNPKLAKLIK